MDEFFARNRLSAFIDGELPDAEMVEVVNAIERYPALRSEYEDLLAAVRFMRRHGPSPAPHGFHLRVMRAVEGVRSPRRRLSWLFGPLRDLSWEGTAVVAVAVAVLALVWFAPGPGPDGAATSAVQGPADADVLQGVPEGAPPPVQGESGKEPDARSMTSEDGGSAGQAGGVGEQGLMGAGGADALAGGPAGAQKEDQGATAGRLAPIGSAEEAALRAASGKASSNRIQDKAARNELESWIPEWDRNQPGATKSKGAPAQGLGGTTSTGALVASPFAFRLNPGDPDVLVTLSALADSLGGRALRSDGGALEPQALSSEHDRARIVMQVPASELDRLEPALRKLGTLTRVEAPGDHLYSVNAVQVYIDVHYEP